MTFLAVQALLPLAPSELGHVYEHGLLPSVSLSSAGHQPVSEDWIHALLLRHSSCLQTPIVPPVSPAQDRSEAAGLGRTPGGSRGGRGLRGSPTLLKLRLLLASEMKRVSQGKEGRRAPLPGYAVLGSTCKEHHHPFTAEGVCTRT